MSEMTMRTVKANLTDIVGMGEVVRQEVGRLLTRLEDQESDARVLAAVGRRWLEVWDRISVDRLLVAEPFVLEATVATCKNQPPGDGRCVVSHYPLSEIEALKQHLAEVLR